MKIISIIENTSISPEYESKHGLSFYIETKTKKILADLGPDGTFLENAKKMGIEIFDIDMVFISHGHNDHGGGLKYFLDNNEKANIYVSNDGFNNYYVNKNNEMEYIGLEKVFENNDRIFKVGDFIKVDDEVSIFSGVTERKCFSKANDILMAEKDQVIIKDSFTHEQYLVIKEDEKTILIGGCAHNGILNILKRFKEIYKQEPDLVLSGFHLYNSIDGTPESDELLNEISQDLNEYKSRFYTCHCTGKYQYDFLKKEMGKKIGYISTGMILDI